VTPEFKKYVPLLSRSSYVGLALLWYLLNKDNFVLSAWDATRIHVPISWYLGVPPMVLILYALLPNLITWTLIVITLTIGWGLHAYESLMFDYAHMGVKTDVQTTIIQMIEFLILFAVCIAILYILGPYVRRKYATNKKH